MPSSSKKPDIRRQAVVVIHGMGEQRPMTTLRDFVDQITPAIQNSNKPKYYSKPDLLSDSFELRRLTANEHRYAFKTDYYEFYWAHLMSDTKLGDVGKWIRMLFIRSPASVPARLRPIYFFAWTAAIALLALLGFFLSDIFEFSRQAGSSNFLDKIQQFTNLKSQTDVFLILKFTGGVFFSLLLGYINFFLVKYLGDVVTYLTPRPQNIAARQKIRSAGLKLLEKLHEKYSDGSDRYDRVIVVGHSLGSVIAYDLINLFWIKKSSQFPKIDRTVLEPIESEADNLLQNQQGGNDSNTEKDRQNFTNQQFSFWSSQLGHPESWKISDFITLGSPLAYVDLLLSSKEYSIDDKKAQREFPTCPPTMEKNDRGESFFSYPLKKNEDRNLNHAAPFSMTRWNNIFFKNDHVGGAIEKLGPGIHNFPLNSRSRPLIPFLSHTHYWGKSEQETKDLILNKLSLRF